MPVVPVVPKSLTRPVPASQARSAIQEQIDASRDKVERLNGSTQRQVVRQLVALEAELRERLESMRRDGRGESWTAADTEATLVQVRELLGRQGREFRAMLAANAETARRLGVKNTAAVLQHFEGKRGGPVRPLALDAAAAAQSPLLARHEASVVRYGARTIGRVAEAMQRGLLVGDTFDEMRDRLVGKRGQHGVLVASAGDAARIVRTEGMHAYNAGAHEEALAQRAKRFPDLQKKLVETFDSRTAADSRTAHGEVRDLEALFVDGAGRRYLHPPGRPNDRGVEIPWRPAWEGDKDFEVLESIKAQAPLAESTKDPPDPTPTSPDVGSEPRAKAQAWAGSLHEAISTGNGPKARGLLREMVSEAGMSSFDEVLGRRNRDVYVHVPGWRLAGGEGLHQWDGAILIKDNMHAYALEALELIASGKPILSLSVQQFNGLAAMIHEACHEASRVIPASFEGAGNDLEEGTTEILTRRMMRRFFGIPDGQFGKPTDRPYKDADGNYVASHRYAKQQIKLCELVEKHVPSARGRVVEALEDAILATRAPSEKKAWDTPRDHALALGRALGLADDALEAFANDAVAT